MFGAQLNDSCAAVEIGLKEIRWSPAAGGRGIDIENGVKRWKFQEASAREPGPPFVLAA